MLVDTFDDVQKEYNAGEESCRVSLESRLRQDTFEALQALNAESWGGEDVPEIVQGKVEGRCAQTSPRAEGYSGEFDRVRQKRIPPTVQETSQTAGQRGLRASQPTDVSRSWNYQQRTRITGEDPLKVSLGATYVARNDGRKSGTGRGHIIGPRSIDVYRSRQYWQKTKIIGKDPLDVSGGTTRMAQEDELIEASVSVRQRSSVSVQVNDSGNVTRTAEDNGDAMSYRDLSSAQSSNVATAALGLSNLSDRLEEVRASLGLRTSTEIFDDLQEEYEVARAQGKTKRRRIRRPSHEQEFETLALGDTWQRRIRGQRTRQSGVGGVNDGEWLEQADATGETGRGSIMVRMGLQSDDDDGVNVEDRRDWMSETGVTRRGRIRGPRERRTPEGEEVAEGRGREELSAVLDSLEEEFQQKERLSESKEWCDPIPHHRKVSTVQRFYTAFHDPKTLPIYTCMICYRKFALTELKDADWEAWVATFAELRHASQFRCRTCFPPSEKVLACGECVKASGKGALSPAGHLHSRLGCEHKFPQELEGLTPVEEKLIALNSCYGFITKYSRIPEQCRGGGDTCPTSPASEGDG